MNTNYENLNKFMYKLAAALERAPVDEDLTITVGDYDLFGFTISDVQKAFADCRGEFYTLVISKIEVAGYTKYVLKISRKENPDLFGKVSNPELNSETNLEEVSMNTNYSFVSAREMNAVANEFISNNLNFISDCINIRASRGHFNWFYSTTSDESEADWEIAIKGALIAAGYEVERTYSGDEDGSWGYRISW